jgi:endonuclease YncB( thermonuclease family)
VVRVRRGIAVVLSAALLLLGAPASALRFSNVSLSDELVRVGLAEYRYYPPPDPLPPCIPSEFTARVYRVIDGDTIDVVPTSFHPDPRCLDRRGVTFRYYGAVVALRIRFARINAPEIYHPASEEEYELGMRAKRYVEERIPAGTPVRIHAYGLGYYRRIIAEVYPPAAPELARILRVTLVGGGGRVGCSVDADVRVPGEGNLRVLLNGRPVPVRVDGLGPVVTARVGEGVHRLTLTLPPGTHRVTLELRAPDGRTSRSYTWRVLPGLGGLEARQVRFDHATGEVVLLVRGGDCSVELAYEGGVYRRTYPERLVVNGRALELTPSARLERVSAPGDPYGALDARLEVGGVTVQRLRIPYTRLSFVIDDHPINVYPGRSVEVWELHRGLPSHAMTQPASRCLSTLNLNGLELTLAVVPALNYRTFALRPDTMRCLEIDPFRGTLGEVPIKAIGRAGWLFEAILGDGRILLAEPERARVLEGAPSGLDPLTLLDALASPHPPTHGPYGALTLRDLTTGREVTIAYPRIHVDDGDRHAFVHVEGRTVRVHVWRVRHGICTLETTATSTGRPLATTLSPGTGLIVLPEREPLTIVVHRTPTGATTVTLVGPDGGSLVPTRVESRDGATRYTFDGGVEVITRRDGGLEVLIRGKRVLRLPAGEVGPSPGPGSRPPRRPGRGGPRPARRPTAPLLPPPVPAVRTRGRR